jgi:hypothetical protein
VADNIWQALPGPAHVPRMERHTFPSLYRLGLNRTLPPLRARPLVRSENEFELMGKLGAEDVASVHGYTSTPGMGVPDSDGFGRGSDSGGFGWISSSPAGGTFAVYQSLWAF